MWIDGCVATVYQIRDSSRIAWELGDGPGNPASRRRRGGMAAGSQGMQMQMALQVRTEFLHQVADQDFAHLLVAELNSLHQRTELVVGIPVGGDHARAVGAGNLRYVERQPSVLRGRW